MGAFAHHGQGQYPPGYPPRLTGIRCQLQTGTVQWWHERFVAAAERHERPTRVSHRQRLVCLLRRPVDADLLGRDVYFPSVVRLARGTQCVTPDRLGLRQRAPYQPGVAASQPRTPGSDGIHPEEPAQCRGRGVHGHAAATSPTLAEQKQQGPAPAIDRQRSRRNHSRRSQDLPTVDSIPRAGARRLSGSGTGN
ncbi:hypothetical protein D3C84_528850 [compost metagenome]